MSVFKRLVDDGFILDYPLFVKDSIQYEAVVGSAAYGVSDIGSDVDVYGFCIPPKNIIYPYNNGHIFGFGKKPEIFEQFQKHHIMDRKYGKEYDIVIYNIVKFFNLVMENNPNMIDALFVPDRCVLTCTDIGKHVRDNRKLFLTKRVWHKFKGYAFSQLHKMRNKHMKYFVDYIKEYDLPIDASKEELLVPVKHNSEKCGRILTCLNNLEHNGKRSKRIKDVYKYGFDVKFAYHIVRLLDECQMILEEHDLDLTRSREHLKAIRKGEWTEQQVVEYFENKMPILEDVYNKSDLRYSPDEHSIKKLLVECIEMYHGKDDSNNADISEVVRDNLIVIEKSIQNIYRNL